VTKAGTSVSAEREWMNSLTGLLLGAVVEAVKAGGKVGGFLVGLVAFGRLVTRNWIVSSSVVLLLILSTMDVKSLIGLLLGVVGVFLETGGELGTGELVERDCSGSATIGTAVVLTVEVKSLIGLLLRVVGVFWEAGGEMGTGELVERDSSGSATMGTAVVLRILATVGVKSLIGLLLGVVGVFSEAGWEVSTGEVVERNCRGAPVVLLTVATV